MRVTRCITRHVYSLKLHVEELRPLKTLKAPRPGFSLFILEMAHILMQFAFSKCRSVPA